VPTITQIEYIVALHRTGHFARAAAECGVSQPTLSAQLARAEEELGVVLFDRRARPVVPTEPGQRLIGMCQDVLRAHERLLAAAGETPSLSGSFTLGVIPTLAPYVLPWALGPFAERYPAVELTVLERTTAGIVEELHAMRMDAGLLATPLGEPGLDAQVLFYDPFYVYAQRGSDLLDRDEVAVDDIDRRALWLLQDGHCFRSQVVYLCGLEAREILGNIRFEAGSFETLRGLIDDAGGCTLIPETYARTLPADLRRERVRPLREPVPTREVSLVAHRDHYKTDIVGALARLLRERAPRSLLRELGSGEVMPILGPPGGGGRSGR
jgi:LysR family hydrogen peroxide-inducible transcriptional activator